MTAPIPHEVLTLESSLDRVAADAYLNYAWIARWSREIVDVDADLDVKKLAQLALIHCPKFAALTNDLTDPLVVALETRFAACGLEWPTRDEMVQDIKAIKAAAAALSDFCKANHQPLFENATTVKWANEGRSIEVPTKVEKPAMTISRVRELRDLFA